MLATILSRTTLRLAMDSADFKRNIITRVRLPVERNLSKAVKVLCTAVVGNMNDFTKVAFFKT